jgi:uncharacterized membrane protein YkoI
MTYRNLLLAAVSSIAIGCGGSQDKPTVPPPNLPVSMEQARTAALTAVPGQVEKEELEDEHGKWVYEFDIRPAAAGAPVKEVEIDAQTGAVLKVEDD